MFRVAVIDNSTLISFTVIKHLNIFAHLQNLFSRIHVPTEVKREYESMLRHEPNRAWFLEKLKPNTGFYSFCTQFDSIVLSMIQSIKHIDGGEAEAVAQLMRLSANYVLSDDQKFSEALKLIYPNVKVISTLHVLAMLDLNRITLDSDRLIQTLYKERPFPKSRLRKAYIDSYSELGIKLSKKIVDWKCDFNRLKLN
jgi:predicted nucleic acid-binding protein